MPTTGTIHPNTAGYPNLGRPSPGPRAYLGWSPFGVARVCTAWGNPYSGAIQLPLRRRIGDLRRRIGASFYLFRDSMANSLFLFSEGLSALFVLAHGLDDPRAALL